MAAEIFTFAPRGLVPVKVWLADLIASVLPGALEEQNRMGDYWFKRRGQEGHDDCTGCFTCAIRIRPLRDVADWAVEHGKLSRLPREDIIWAIQEGIRLSGIPATLSDLVEGGN